MPGAALLRCPYAPNSTSTTMPIYAYKCSACGHAKDVLQKMSDAPLTVCPACGAEQFSKQLTAAGFQLKGSGWDGTDFRDGGANKGGSGGGDKKAEGSDAAVPASPAPASDSSAASPTPAPAAAPAPAASSPAPSSSSAS